MKLYTRDFKIDVTSSPNNIYNLKTREHYQLYLPITLIIRCQSYLNPIAAAHARNELNDLIHRSI
jgi:hypothetical protein